MSILYFILIGIVAGWLAGLIMKGSGFGILWDLILGVIGAVIGGLIAQALHLELSGVIGHLISATVGAILLLALLRLIKRRG